MQGIFYSNFESSYLPHILKEVYMDRIYDSFSDYISGGTVAEIGANVGAVIAFFQKTAARVVAVEPSQQHCDCIRKMCEFNGYENVQVIQAALFREDGEFPLFHNDNQTMFSLHGAVNSLPDEVEKVRSISFATLLKEGEIDTVDFLKCDVEGSEFDVMTSQSFIDNVQKIRSLVVEYHTWSGQNPDQMITMLNDYGFTVERLKTDATVFGAKR